MGAFGEVAVQSAELVRSGACDSALKAWETAALTVFPHSESQREKSCPRVAFLGLCEAGLVAGVPASVSAKASANKDYAVRAARLLALNPGLAASKTADAVESRAGRRIKNVQLSNGRGAGAAPEGAPGRQPIAELTPLSVEAVSTEAPPLPPERGRSRESSTGSFVDDRAGGGAAAEETHPHPSPHRTPNREAPAVTPRAGPARSGSARRPCAGARRPR